MGNEKNGGEEMISSLKIDTCFGHDAGGDFSLPDYMPEIKRLLAVNATVLPEGKFLNGNVMELDGTVAYSVLYFGDDNSLSCTSLLTEYSADTALSSSVENASDVFCDCEIENTVCRVTGPRNLNIKSRLKSRLVSDEYLTGECGVTDAEGARIVTVGEAGVERLTCSVSSAVRKYGLATGSSSGEITVSDEAKPVSCEGALSVSSVRTTEDGVAIEGNICVKCLFRESEGEYRCAKTSIPFDISVPISDADGDGIARGWGRVASVSLTSSDDGSGKFFVGVEYDVEAEILKKKESSICVDAYSSGRESENEYRECDVLVPVWCDTKKLTLTGECDVKNHADEAKIVDTTCTVSPIQITVSDGKVWAIGTVKAKAVALLENEAFSPEAEIALKAELCAAPSGCAASELQSRPVCTVTDVSGRISGGKLSVSCELIITAEIMKKQRMKYVTSVKLGEKDENAGAPCIKVYYPAADENVWAICKKYRADRSKLMKNNTFDGDIAPKGKPIIIA